VYAFAGRFAQDDSSAVAPKRGQQAAITLIVSARR